MVSLQLLAANRTKKGYYIRRVKEGLWATFGINRLKPYDENFTREQLKNWKVQENVRKAYNDLYTPIDPNDSNSEMFISMIIKNVFVSTEEQTDKNAVWTQAILEMIFDEEHLSTKIDSDTVDTWYSKLNKVSQLFLVVFLIIK